MGVGVFDFDRKNNLENIKTGVYDKITAETSFKSISKQLFCSIESQNCIWDSVMTILIQYMNVRQYLRLLVKTFNKSPRDAKKPFGSSVSFASAIRSPKIKYSKKGYLISLRPKYSNFRPHGHFPLATLFTKLTP